MPTDEKQLLLSPGKDGNNQNGYALIYIWKPLLTDIYLKRKVGHIAVQLYDENCCPVVDGHISAWPEEQNSVRKIKFLRDIADTRRHENNADPDETFKIDHLNVEKIRNNFHRKKSQVEWGLFGSGFFRNSNKTINCVGIVLELFKEEFNKNKNLSKATGKEKREAEERKATREEEKEEKEISNIVIMIGAGYNNSQGRASCKRCSCSTLVSAIMLLFGLFLLYLSILGLIVTIFHYAERELPNFPLKSVWKSVLMDTKDWSVWTIFIGATMGTIISVIFILVSCLNVINVFSSCSHTIRSFAGIAPNDVSRLLNYFSCNKKSNISKVEGEDGPYVEYSTDLHSDEDRETPDDPLTRSAHPYSV